MNIEAKGKLIIIGETQSFPSGFTKREFVIETAHDKYPQKLKFEVTKDKCITLENLRIGQNVTVDFDVRGNEYNGKYYVNLQAWKIVAEDLGVTSPEYGQRETQQYPAAMVGPHRDNSAADNTYNDQDDIPF